MSWTAVRMQNPAALDLEEIRMMLKESLAKLPFDPEQVAAWLRDNVTDPDTLMVLVRDEEKWVGYMLCHNAPWVFGPAASQIMVWVHPEVGKEVRRMLTCAVGEWMHERGITEMDAVCRPGTSVEAYQRHWDGYGVRIKDGLTTMKVFPEE